MNRSLSYSAVTVILIFNRAIKMEPNSILKLDFSSKLEITINNLKPVVLTDLTLALLGVGQQYQKFIENETNEQHAASSELFVKEVRSGSIVVELIAQALPVLPLLWEGGSLLEWMNHSKSVIEWLNGGTEKQDLKQWSNILEPVAKDNGSQMNFTVSSGATVNQFFISSEQANAAQNAIKREISKLEEPDDHIQRKRVMVWHQTRFEAASHVGDKAVIESITKQPVKVIFENNAVKRAMLGGDTRFSKQWHELAYIVDVRIQTVNDVPKVYTIIDYHDDDTFDPNSP
jgi:hypothetical protein